MAEDVPYKPTDNILTKKRSSLLHQNPSRIDFFDVFNPTTPDSRPGRCRGGFTHLHRLTHLHLHHATSSRTTARSIYPVYAVDTLSRGRSRGRVQARDEALKRNRCFRPHPSCHGHSHCNEEPHLFGEPSVLRLNDIDPKVSWVSWVSSRSNR